MKKIEAIIRHHLLDAVKTALTASGVQGITVTEVRGAGRSRPQAELYRGAEYAVDFTPKLKVEILAADADVAPLIAALRGAARTGEVGDGYVAVYDLEQVVRVRTGERAEEAL